MTPRKYGNKITTYNGHKFHSKMEAGDAMWLDSLVKAEKIAKVEYQHKLSIDVLNTHICNHFVDFLVTLNDGRQKYCETKGVKTATWRIKMKLVKVLYPDTPYLVNTNEEELLS